MATLKSTMTATVIDHMNWTYAPVRPEPVPATWKKGQHVRADCSKGVQFIAKWGGAPDPMRSNWGMYGNSTTIWLNLPHILRADLQIGDIVVWGPDVHACMIYSLAADPTVWNMGMQGQPAFKKLSQEIAGHPGVPYWFCQLRPEPPPTAEDELRAKTGFFSWVAWKLGEGPWKAHGPGDRKVRPDVPHRIPLEWWKDYLRFLRNRKSGNKT